jgi:hypothetical protein
MECCDHLPVALRTLLHHHEIAERLLSFLAASRVAPTRASFAAISATCRPSEREASTPLTGSAASITAMPASTEGPSCAHSRAE